MRRALILLLLSSPCAHAADQWTRLTTPHFELYTTAGKKKGRDLILHFEQVRSFFVQAAPVKSSGDFPIRIIVFRSEKQYKPYAPNEVAAAFYTQGHYRDYIVMGDADPEHLPVAIHEFMHLVMNHSGLKLPVWLNEGWADLYSTLKPMGSKAMVGDLIPGRVQVLQSEKWLSFDALTSVGLKSETYNEKNRAGIFYAESWALVHMLYLGPEYAPRFSAFVAALHKGRTAAEACQLVYGRSSAQVYADLQAYLRRNSLFGAVFNVKLTKPEEEAEAAQATPFESETVLADLLSVAGKRERAAEAFRRLAAENPGKPEIAQSMGYLAWQNNDRDGARQEFAMAFAAGGRDPEMCYHLAMLEVEKNKTSDLAIAALHRALEVKPDYTDARLQLAFFEMNAHDYKAALAAFHEIRQIDDDRAPNLFNALAYTYLQTGAYDDARKQAEMALKWDRTDFDKMRSQEILRYLDSRKDERVERIEGAAKNVDCEGKRFVLEVDGKPIVLDMPDPTRVPLACGPQKPVHVVVEYVPSNAPGNSRGTLRNLAF